MGQLLKEIVQGESDDSDRVRSDLRVSEIFYSLQGEGVRMGEPAVFLRLAACNLHCWYCDTKYTWLFSERMLRHVQRDMRMLGIKTMREDLRVYDSDQEVQRLDLAAIQKKILAYGCNHLVVTGGEPMLQQEGLIPLIQGILDETGGALYTEVETNGTIKPTKRILELVSQWNVSPKLRGSGNSQHLRELPEVLEAFGRVDNAYFKFAIQNPDEVGEVDDLVNRYRLSPERIILMPEGCDAKTVSDRGSWLWRVCKDKGYRFTTRLHILLYGNRRGI